MSPLTQIALIAGSFFVAISAAQWLGHRIGRRRTAAAAEGGLHRHPTLEAAILALLGLLVAFTFSGASHRFNVRQALVIDHVNAIGTAWLRLDLLPAEDRDAARDLFRRYVEGLGEATRATNRGDLSRLIAEQGELEDALWDRSVAAATRVEPPYVASLVLPALNQVFDLSAARLLTGRIHLQREVLALLILVGLLSGVVAGHAQASERRVDPLFTLIFSTLISAALFVILDFEHPRIGFIQLQAGEAFVAEILQRLD